MAELKALMHDYFRERDEIPLANLCESASSADEAPAESLVEVDTAFGYVYLIKMGKHHKIGRSNSAGRRQYELAIQLPEKTKLIHQIQTDDPEGIERYWHQRFADRNTNGEWFALTADDIRAFKRRKFM